MTFRQRETLVALCLVVPAFVAVGVFLYYPIVQTILYSFFDLRYTTDLTADRFIGWRNYADVLRDGQFWNSFRFTIYFTVMAVLLEFWIGLGMAMASFQVKKPVRWLLRAMIIVPWAIPPVIQASLWRWLLNSDVGLINTVLLNAGIVSEPPLWLSRPVLAVHSVIFAYVWRSSAITAIFLMGGLALIPNHLYEAAKIDGAGAWTRFRRLTLPLLAPTILATLLFRTIDALRAFDIVYGLTGGGPGSATEILSAFTYNFYFRFSLFGLGSAYAVVTFLLVAGISLFYIGRLQARLRFRE